MDGPFGVVAVEVGHRLLVELLGVAAHRVLLALPWPGVAVAVLVVTHRFRRRPHDAPRRAREAAGEQDKRDHPQPHASIIRDGHAPITVTETRRSWGALRCS